MAQTERNRETEKQRMAQTEQRLTKFVTYQFLKKITKLVLSLFVFSFFLSYSSWYSFFLHSVKLHFTTFSSHILSQTMNKNCLFLLCNGILVFLAKTSGFTQFSPNNLADQLLEKLEHEDDSQISPVMKEYSLLGKEVSTEASQSQQNVILRQNDDDDDGEDEEEEEEYSTEVESDPHKGSNMILEDKEQEIRTGFFIKAGQEDDHEEDGGMSDEEGEDSNEESKTKTGFMMEEHGEDDIGLLSTDELNKKFDEFIRRVKEEMRIGSQQLLVLAQ